jgi:selenide,water dikinase
MAKASFVTLTIESEAVPLLPDVIELIEQKMLTRGDRNNRVYVGETVRMDNKVSGAMQSALFDPQTAGGLLVSLPAERLSEYLDEVPGAVAIGKVREKGDLLIEVV